MPTPSTFRLQPTTSLDEPPPKPPRIIKCQIYDNVDVFKIVDKHATNEARTNYRNFRDLIYNLIFKKNYTELEKARIIFRWMTIKNLYTIMFNSQLPDSPESIIGGFKDGLVTYARIFQCLCRHAGLQCVVINGWAKGVEYRPGQKITDTVMNHGWNAVLIDSNWQLIDSHWAARYLMSEKNTIDNLVYEYDDFYFLTNPANLVYSHCPEDHKWQLLHPASSRSKFEDYPLIKSFFFHVGLRLLSQELGVVYTRDGLLTLTLGYTLPATFTFKLNFGENMLESVHNTNLKRYIMQETTEDRITLYFRAPKEGNYYLTLFAQPDDKASRANGVYKATCEYKIICNQASQDNHPYPLCTDSNWGAGLQVGKYGLTALHTQAIIAASPKGRVQIAFQKSNDVRLFARLVNDGLPVEKLENCVSVDQRDDRIYITAQVPFTGEYGLEVYANEPASDGDTFTHMCQYLITHTNEDLGQVYGQIFDRSDLTYATDADPMIYSRNGEQYITKAMVDAKRIPSAQRQNSGNYATFAGKQGMRSDQYSNSQSLQRGQTGQDFYKGQAGQPFATISSSGSRNAPQLNAAQYGRQECGDQDNRQDTLIRNMQQDQYNNSDPSTFRRSNEKIMNKGMSQDNSRHGSQDDIELSHRMDSNTITGSQRRGPPVANKPKSGRTLKQSSTENEDSNLPPIEVVYVGNSPRQGRHQANSRGGSLENLDKIEKEVVKADPIEVVYIKQNANGKSPQFARKQSEDFPAPPDNSIFTTDHELNTIRAVSPVAKRKPPITLPKPKRTVISSKDTIEDTATTTTTMNRSEQFTSNKPAKASRIADQRKEDVISSYQQPYPFGTMSNSVNKDQNKNQNFISQQVIEPEIEYNPHPQKVYSSSIEIKAPANFKPVPITDISTSQAVPQPAPVELQQKPFRNTEIFTNVDTHAVEVSKESHKNFRDLVWHLIFARDITNELEKARAIFLWLCSKDLQKLQFEQVGDDSPEEILMSLKKQQTTYAVVFEILCNYAGLHCKTISGYAKGAEYRPGMKFGQNTDNVTAEQGQHSWNAVLVNGAWRLVDCHWAARRLVGKKISLDNVRYELDEYYFMPDPHQLIFTHYPDDSSWQLLSPSITLADFENLVPVKSAFFKYGLQIVSHRDAVVKTQGAREVTVRIACPPQRSTTLSFTFTLTYDVPDSKESDDTYDGLKLSRYGMQEMVDNISYFTIRPPRDGAYRLTIYVKDTTPSANNTGAPKDGVYGGVCEYQLIRESAPTNQVAQPFPPCVNTSWGMGEAAFKYSLKPRQRGAIFSTVEGQAEVRFDVDPNLRFTAKLKTVLQDEEKLAGYLNYRLVDSVAVFTVSAPTMGEYGLEIYANNPSVDGNALYHAYQYLILCNDTAPVPIEPLPFLPPGYLGPQPTFSNLALRCATHVDPYVQTTSGVLDIAFGNSADLPAVRMTSQLVYVSAGRSDDVSEYILQQTKLNPVEGTTVIFALRLPFAGLYKLQVFGVAVNDESDSLPAVYNYLIRCHGNENKITFPKQYGQWKEGCYLFSPLDSPIERSQNLNFQIDVPTASSVAIVIDNAWTHLERKQPTLPWQGVVNTTAIPKGQKVAICANFGTGKDSYSTLLEYES